MADSPAHRFGQVIGGLLEEILQPELQKFADSRGLFLDKHGKRKDVRKGQKLSWIDSYGNSHDLDFVIEKGASPGVQGRPVAFIEAAWRRYTKHSKAKAQEIQGSVLPIAEKYDWDRPFLGAILAGEFTKPSLEQLKSNDFILVYIPYESIISIFYEVGIDARFDEKTPDRDFKRCVDQIDNLPKQERNRLRIRLIEINRGAFDEFFSKLRRKLDRIISRVTILPLFGTSLEFENVREAASFIANFDAAKPTSEFQKYEVIVRFSNGDKVDGLFSEQKDALKFLEYISS